MSAETDRLGAAADLVAEVLDVDPERIMYDAKNNQVCIPVGLVEQLLAQGEVMTLEEFWMTGMSRPKK